MIFRTIFVPVRGDGRGESVLDHALALARRFDGHLEVNHCRPRPGDMLPLGTYLNAAMRETITASAKTMADDEEKRLRELFDAYCKEHDLDVVDTLPWPVERCSISWRERTGKQPDIISRYALLADVVAVAQPEREGQLGHASLEAAIFTTGSLTLMCPHAKVETLGSHIAIAWNGGEEAARTLRMALPLLVLADKVTLLTVDTGADAGPGAEEVSDYLVSHGIAVDHSALSSSRTGVGKALLDAVADNGADILLMGAYGQSRHAEIIFGGVTRHIVDRATIPVLMTH